MHAVLMVDTLHLMLCTVPFLFLSKSCWFTRNEASWIDWDDVFIVQVRNWFSRVIQKKWARLTKLISMRNSQLTNWCYERLVWIEGHPYQNMFRPRCVLYHRFPRCFFCCIVDWMKKKILVTKLDQFDLSFGYAKTFPNSIF